MRFLVRKAVSFILTLFLISVITFGALQILPGDPALLILGTEGDPQALASLRQELGLDLPSLVRYQRWVAGILQGDFGRSVRYSRPVGDLLLDALPLTLVLAIWAVVLATMLSIPLGVFCATHRGSFLDSAVLVLAQFGMSIPTFWMALLLIQLFAVRLGWLPASGGHSEFDLELILPAVALSLPRTAILTRMVRANVLEVLGQDYIRTARSKGLSGKAVLYRHVLRNASVNIFTTAGIHLTQLLAGTIVIEQVFGLPGLGQLLLAGVMQRDLPLVQGLVVVGALLILGANFLFDLALAWLDPRIRFQ